MTGIKKVLREQKRTILVHGAFRFCTNGDNHWLYA